MRDLYAKFKAKRTINNILSEFYFSDRWQLLHKYPLAYIIFGLQEEMKCL